MSTRRIRSLTLVLLALSLAGPGAAQPSHETEQNPPSVAGRPDQRSPQLASVVAGNTAFAIDLYHQLRGQPGDLFFSPLSISRALAMAYVGARTHTEREMAEVLHFDLPQVELHAAMGAMARGLAQARAYPMDTGGSGAADRPPELLMANSLWAQPGRQLLDVFTQTNREHYDAGVRRVDFAADPEGARRRINEWIAHQTRARIPELLLPGDLDAGTALVLTDAIYFRGFWGSRFEERLTSTCPFFSAERESAKVPMMRQVATFPYAHQPGFAVLELPYEGSDLAMAILLPDPRAGLGALEQQLTAELLDVCFSQLSPERVQVTLPRLRLRSRFDLAEGLIDLGMASAFRADADFSGVTGAKGFFIDKVIHEAEIEVDEEGSEASAATAVIKKLGAAPVPPVEFIADHPFVILIRDCASGSILFLGRVVEP